MRKIILIFIGLFISHFCFSQDFSNKGKEFWFCFPNHIPSGNSLGQMSLWITSDQASSGTITMTNGTFTATFNIPANGIQSINIPYNLAHISNAESGTIIQKSLKVKVDPGKPGVVAYVQQYGNARSAATLLLPTNVLGRKYRAVSFTHTATNGGTPSQNSRSHFQIISTKPNTQVIVTPFSNGVAGAPFPINFTNEGDMYQYQAQSDVTGTFIESVSNGTSPCAPVAVFSGNSAVTFGTSTPNCNGGSFDPLFQQNYPISTWGKNFGFIPFGDYNGNPYRVIASEDNTIVSFNGIPVATLNAGQIYPAAFTTNPVILTTPTSITADKPICVAQYAQARDCSGSNNGDPDMVILNPIEQNIKDITIFSSTQQNINRQWINVLIKTIAAPSFRIDGLVPTTAFQPAPNIPGYSYMKHLFNPAIQGSHFLSADSGFNAICYGYQQGQYESYAYSAGTNVKDLYQQILVNTEFGIEQTPSVCTNSPFRFKVSLPYCTDSIKWNLSNLPGPPIAPPTSIFSTCVPGPGGPDSTTVVNGKTIYWYSLATLYSFSTVGTYPVTITTFFPNGECGNSQDIDFDLQVSAPPVPSFTVTIPGCYTEPVQFIETTPQTPKPTYKWYWDFGDGNTSISKNPVHTYTAPGTYTVRYASITTPGCLSDTIQQQITVPKLPEATISGTTAVCVNAAAPVITFTGAEGLAPYEFTYNINGGAPLTVNSTGTTATISVPTVTAGTFIFNLVSVRNVGSSLCTQPQTGSATVIVNPLPTATVTGNTTVCLNDASPNITFTGAVGTAPYTFTYNINGGTPLTVSTTVGNAITVAVPTNVSGTFIYNLLSVQDASITTCSQNQTGSVTVIVKDLPTATIAGTINVCLNATSPNITFTGAVGIAPYTFTYNINGGAPLTVTTTVGNSITVTAPTTTVGTFIYNLLSVREGSANACVQNQTGSATVIVNPLPTAMVAGNTAVCLNDASPNITFTGAGSTAPYTFTYNINGGAPLTVTTTVGNAVTVAVPTNVSGTFIYNLLSVMDASSTTCSQNQTGSASVTVHPLPVINFTNTAPSCETRDILFTDNSNPLVGTLTNWAWNFGDPGSGVSNTSAFQNPTHTFSTAGNYTVSLNVITSNGCTNAAAFTRIVTINNRPLAGYIIPEVCLSDTYAQFLDTSKVANGGITAWAWNFGDPFATIPNPNTSTVQNPQHSYTAVGTYPVQLIATSNTGCKDTIIQNLVINGSFPVANFTVNNPTTLCANDSVAIVNTSTVFPGTITKVEIYWDNANFPAVFELDNNPFSGKVYKHKYNNFQAPLTQTFTIRYRAYSGGVCVNDRISTITINAAPLVQFNNMPDACFDAAPFQITQASEIGGVPGTFVYSGPGVTAGGIFTPALAGIGTHTLKYTFTSTAASCVDTMSKTITVLDTASARFSFISPTCEGSATTFKEESTAPTGVVLSNTVWDFGDGSPLENHAPGTTFTHIYTTTGTYTVSMYNTSAYGCRSTATARQVLVSPIPAPAFGFDKTSYCLPDARVSFINNSSIADNSGLTYLWNFDDPNASVSNPNTSTGFAPSHTYTSTGPFNVTLTVTSNVGCINSIPVPLLIVHPQPVTDFAISNNNGVCIRDAVTFTDITNGLDGTVTQWFWDLGDASTRNTRQVLNYIYGSAKTFDVSLYTVNSHGCPSTLLTKQFTVHPYPVVDAGPDRVVLEGGSITIQSVVTGNDLQYLWTPNTYLIDTKVALPTAANMLDDITYTITVTARGGCISSDKMFVKVLKYPKIPNTFTPNGDGINETWIIEYLETYPNNKVQVFTRTGQLVFESRGYKTPWDGKLNGKSLPFDTYYYIVEPESGRKPITGYVTIIK